MTNGQPTTLMKQVRKLVAAQAYRELSDAQLLDRFRDQHDEAAFAALMERHGAMVLGVCRRVLGNHHDAEDACQATFLVLARKSSSIRKKDALGSWLHGAAFRIAADLKKRLTRRGSPETYRRPASAMATDLDVSWREVQCILDEELARLPDNYRLPVVLCCLEGKARDEAAQQVGWSSGSFRGRLERGREMLRARLMRRGVTLSIAMLGTVLAGNGTAASLPPTLALATCNAAARFISGKSVATGAISATVASLTQRMVQTMFLTKLKVAAVMLMILALGGGGASMILADRTASAQASQPAAAEKPTAPTQKPNQEKETFTVWGKEVGGLQAGLGYRPGERRAYYHGETVTLVLRVRNVSKEAVEFKHIWAFFVENPPTITDADGKPVRLPRIRAEGFQRPRSTHLAPGTGEVALYEWRFDLRPEGKSGSNTTIHGTGKFSLQCERIVGPTSANPIHPNPTLSKLASGKLELEVKADPPPHVHQPSKDEGYFPGPPGSPQVWTEKLAEAGKASLTSWGKEVGGLQAGLGYHLGQKRAYHHGETVRLVLRVRNVSKNKVRFDYHTAFLRETPPAVTDAKGNAIPLAWPTMPGGPQGLGQVDLAPGKEIEFHDLKLELKPSSEQANKMLRTLYGTGTFHIQYKQADATPSGAGVFYHDPLLSKLATGKLELEVKADPPPPGQRAPATSKMSDFDRLQGKWIPLSCEMNGAEFTAEQLKNFPFNPSFDGNRYMIEFGKVPNEGTFELNPTANPKMITLHDKERSKNLGIYLFKGDQLLICIGESKKPRPVGFTTKVGSGHSLIRFKRVAREDEVREVVDKFFKAALAGDAEKTRALAAPAISDQQLARFKGLAKTLAIAKVQVTPGPAPTSQGANHGRALVVSEEVEAIEGRGKTKGHVVLTLLKDDVRLETKGWLIWDIDLRDQGGVDKEVQAFIERNLKLEVERDKAALTAWGNEVGGLQAGLGYHPGQKRAYRHDETVRLVVRIRNVGQNEVQFRYLPAFLVEALPAITDAKGKPIPLDLVPAAKGQHVRKTVDLAPGKEFELHELKLKLRPASERDKKLLETRPAGEAGNNKPQTLYGTGKFHIQYGRVDGISSLAGAFNLDPRLSKLATGKLELEINDKPVPNRE